MCEEMREEEEWVRDRGSVSVCTRVHQLLYLRLCLSMFISKYTYIYICECIRVQMCTHTFIYFNITSIRRDAHIKVYIQT